MPGEYGDYFDSYSKDKDKDSDVEEADLDDGIDAEDRAEDLHLAVEDATEKGKLTTDLTEAFMEAIDTIDTHYDDDTKEAKRLFDKLQEVLDEINAADAKERIENEEDYLDRVDRANRAAMDLGKK